MFSIVRYSASTKCLSIIFFRVMYTNKYIFRHLISPVIKSGKCIKNISMYSAENLVNRAIIEVKGPDASSFLQGLITNDMNNFDSGSRAIFTMFLNVKGRIIQDSIIYKANREKKFWVECDKTGVDFLEKHLKIYRLKKKVDIEKTDTDIWAVYNLSHVDSLWNQDKRTCEKGIIENEIKQKLAKDVLMYNDPRISLLGIRLLSPKESKVFESNIENVSLVGKTDTSGYKEYRYKLGIAEGLEEIPNNECFPLEMNCDYLNGVSFSKGCYIGQELTARTYYTGVIRKRLMPFVLDVTSKSLDINTHISDAEGKSKFPIGKLRGLQGKVGIGLMRVREALSMENLRMGDITVKPKQPFWWPDKNE